MQGIRRGVAVAGLAILLGLGSGAQGQSAAPKLYTTTHPAMGTVYTLYLYSADPEAAAAISADVFDEIDRIDQLLSNYRDTSELSRINQNAAKGPVTTDPEMMDFLAQSEHWSEASDGGFDITVGRLMKAWGFYRHGGRIPPADELQQLRSATGWQKVKLDLAARTVLFTSAGVELDPGGIGKGFAVDASVRILRAQHVGAAMLSAGGSTIYALGAPPHRHGWRVVVQGPPPSKATLSVITLRDTSLSSADCSEKNFTINQHLSCHIMDPRTMRPVEGRIQVSVVDPSATASDALSNVIFVATPEQSVVSLQRYAPEARALIVSTGAEKPQCTAFRWGEPIVTAKCAVTLHSMHRRTTTVSESP
jgi:thiamine biosynthesis lipoprotein